MREMIINNLVTIQCGSYSEILTFGGFTCILIQFPDKRQTTTTCWECRHGFQELSDFTSNHKARVLLASARGSQ